MQQLLEMLTSAQGGAVVSKLSQQFGLDQTQTQAAMAQLLPAVLGGFKQKAQTSTGGLDDLLGSVLGGGQAHQKYVDRPEELTGSAAVSDGNDLLGQIFGSKDVSRQVAGQAAQNTGIDVGILKQMLPLIAAMAAGALGKAGTSQAAPSSGGLGGLLGSLLGGRKTAQSGGLGGLASLLDFDKDGNPLDDIAGLAGKFLRR